MITLIERKLTKNIRKRKKKSIVETLVWSMVLYGSETWTLQAEEIKRLQAFEMGILRRIEIISCTDKVSNEDALRRVGKERSLIETLERRRKN